MQLPFIHNPLLLHQLGQTLEAQKTVIFAGQFIVISDNVIT
jgi:hypothetical protein